MATNSDFPATLPAAEAAVMAVRPDDYAKSRNFLDGAVTRLSPYLTHGFVSTSEVLRKVDARHSLAAQHKFVFELGWREYYRHVWSHRGSGIFQSLQPGILPEDAYAGDLPADIREARTGIPAIDETVRTLYATGYIHNHARMWLASYVVHLRKIHWRQGADWLYGHLLDGDLASNHLSWQWVASTSSKKPYLFNAENVARYAPPAYHSPGTIIDTTYEHLDALARQPETPPENPSDSGSTAEPILTAEPPQSYRLSTPDPELVRDRFVWVVHPWALGALPGDLPADVLILAVLPPELSATWPWSDRRWAFLQQRLSTITPHHWFADTNTLTSILGAAREVHAQADPHSDSLLPTFTKLRPPDLIFPLVDARCDSFSRWWNKVNRSAKTVADLLNPPAQLSLL